MGLMNMLMMISRFFARARGLIIQLKNPQQLAVRYQG